jgi:hypothetical protein
MSSLASSAAAAAALSLVRVSTPWLGSIVSIVVVKWKVFET